MRSVRFFTTVSSGCAASFLGGLLLGLDFKTTSILVTAGLILAAGAALGAGLSRFLTAALGLSSIAFVGLYSGADLFLIAISVLPWASLVLVNHSFRSSSYDQLVNAIPKMTGKFRACLREIKNIAVTIFAGRESAAAILATSKKNLDDRQGYG
jgi:hypothetical protein